MGSTVSGIRKHWAQLAADPEWARRQRRHAAERAERDRLVGERDRAVADAARMTALCRAPASAAGPVLDPRALAALGEPAPAPGPELYLSGEVGYEIVAADLAAQLAQIGGPATVYLSSPGGDAWQGISCYDVLARHAGRVGQVTVVVDALAASAASVLAMGASPGRLLVQPSSMMMVHEAWAFAGGTSADLRDTAVLLDQCSANIAGIYSARTGRPAAEWLAAMKRETWYTADEAVAAGLADSVTGTTAAGDESADDELYAGISAVLLGQLRAAADPDGQRGFHPDGRPVTREERRAAFEAYARAQAARKAASNGRAFNSAHPEVHASEFVRRMFGLD